MTLLQARGLHLSLPGADILKGIDFDVHAGEIFGVIGESGSGKSMTAFSVMGLTPEAMTRSGEIRLNGADLLKKTEAEMCAVRGAEIGMVFQEPMTALNPVQTIGDQVAETLLIHGAAENRSDKIRFSMDFRLIAEESLASAKEHFASGKSYFEPL